jgi:Holliday junction resolvase RusA-like endonuclease
MVYTFEIPIRPVAKGRPRLGRGRVFTPKKTKVFEAQIRVFYKKHAPKTPLKGPLKVEIVCSLATKNKKLWGQPHDKRPDCDNLQKSILDPANGILFFDDAQVFHVDAKKFYSQSDGIFVRLTCAHVA